MHTNETNNKRDNRHFHPRPQAIQRTQYLLSILLFLWVPFSAALVTPNLPLRPTYHSSRSTQSHAQTIREDGKYGSIHNSTIPAPFEAAQRVGVLPTKNATPKQWKRAWKLHRTILPLLHSCDECRIPDSSLNTACLWWKAMSGNDVRSVVWDEGLSYDVLPRGFRWVVNRRVVSRGWYPRLHHANVEIRTAFLDKAVADIIERVKNDNPRTKIRLVSLGAGYDLRSIKFAERGLVQQTVELDLPQVVEGKQRLLQSKRLLQRRPWLDNTAGHENATLLPTFLPADLNNVTSVRQILTDQLCARCTNTSNDQSDQPDDWHTIFLFEGVMIYLNDGVPSALLNVTSDVLNQLKLPGSLVFADRLENIPGGDEALGMDELQRNGWKLRDWCPKPGLARHMGSADLLSTRIIF